VRTGSHKRTCRRPPSQSVLGIVAAGSTDCIYLYSAGLKCPEGNVGPDGGSTIERSERRGRTMNGKLKIQTLDIDEVTDLELERITGQGCEVCEWNWVRGKWDCWPCPDNRY
jgi:hypothetical protein